MLIPVILLVCLFVILFITSRLIIKSVYQLFLLVTHSRHGSVQLLAWLFLPGTLLHELAHIIVAELLQVKTGRLNLLPQIENEEEVKLGTVSMAESDPFRRTLIGLAPTITGIIALAISAHFLNFGLPFQWLNWLLFWLIFVIANTMFSSAKDLETAAVPAIVVFLVVSSLWLAKVSLPLPPSFLSFIQDLVAKLNLALTITTGLNLLVWLLIQGLVKVIRK